MKQPVCRKTLQELTEFLGVKLQGDPNCVVSGIASLESAKKGEIAFLSNRQYRPFLATTQASAVILSPQDAEACPVHALISHNPRLTLAKVAQLFQKESGVNPGVHPTAVMGEGCQIEGTASIGPHVVLGEGVSISEGVVIEAGCYIGNNCRIEKGTTLKPRVTLYDNVEVGEYCLIHSGAVLGSDGFGFANDAGDWVKMPHLGSVTVGDHVEIGANTTVDRGFLEDTVISDGVIIDNLVQIGHNVFIGARTAIAGCVGIAGSTKIGEGCLIGGRTAIAGHIEIHDRVHITATSSVSRSITQPGVYSSGFPAKPNQLWRKNVARFQYLDEMAKRIKALETLVSNSMRLTEDE